MGVVPQCCSRVNTENSRWGGADEHNCSPHAPGQQCRPYWKFSLWGWSWSYQIEYCASSWASACGWLGLPQNYGQYSDIRLCDLLSCPKSREYGLDFLHLNYFLRNSFTICLGCIVLIFIVIVLLREAISHGLLCEVRPRGFTIGICQGFLLSPRITSNDFNSSLFWKDWPQGLPRCYLFLLLLTSKSLIFVRCVPSRQAVDH